MQQIIHPHIINSSLINKNKKLKEILRSKTQLLEEKNNNYHQILQHLFITNEIDSNTQFNEIKNELYYSLFNENANYAYLLTRRKEIQNGISFILFDEDNTAGVFRKISKEPAFFLPSFIIVQGKKYTITRILENAFKKSNTVLIQFYNDSELISIDKKAFFHSSLMRIDIPASVQRIEEKAFSKCQELEKVKFSNDSQLEYIGKKAFCWSPLKKITLPKHVKIIEDSAFSYCEIKKFNIPEETELKSIGKEFLSTSEIESISIPSDIELKEGWCAELDYLDNVNIIQREEQNIILYENLYIFTKSDLSNETFDVLSFAERSIIVAFIPSFIKKIASYSLSGCRSLEKVFLDNDSQLNSIGKYAFYSSSINHLDIPSNLLILEDNWCCSISDLVNVSISPKNSRFIYLDSSYIIGKSDINSDKYDILHFARRDIKEALIPSFVKEISSYAFHACNELSNIKFSDFSELKVIKRSCFALSKIESIVFPPSVEIIEEYAFTECSNLKKVEFTKDSKIKRIEKDSFHHTGVEIYIIPSSIAELKPGWCSNTSKLNDIIIIENEKQNIKYFENVFILGKSNLESDQFDILIMANHNIQKAIIPSFIKEIASNAFCRCSSLNKIDFDKNSELQSIGSTCFNCTQISSLSIPSSVKNIGQRNFIFCVNFQIFEIPENSELQILIVKDVFYFSNVKIIMIPYKKNGIII